MWKTPLALVFLLTCMFISMENSAQPGQELYKAEWKKVEDFVNKNLPQSALTEVKKIYSQATAKKQEAQVLKCLVALAELQQQTREDNALAVIKEWEAELSGKSPAATAILQSLLAGQYRQYFQEHRWELYQRSSTGSEAGSDISTWSSDQLHAKIASLYHASLSNPSLLQATDLAPFDAIILKGNARKLRPSLFDLLAHEALSYYQSGENAITKPTESFEMDQAAAFDPAADFIHRSFTSPDTTSLEWKALLLYQELLRFHLNDPEPDALIDVDLMRLAFVREKSVHPEADQLYFQSVNHLAHQYENTPAAANAWYQVAAFHYELGQKYNAVSDTSHQYELVKAEAILQKILNNPLIKTGSDTSKAWFDAWDLHREISKPKLSFKLEMVNLPNEPFRALVSYRNTSQTQLRLIRYTASMDEWLDSYLDDESWIKLLAQPAVRNWQQTLPDTRDYQQHHTEIKVDGLEPGKYILLAAAGDLKKDGAVQAGYGIFQVSRISYINRDLEYFVLDRKTGQPLKAAQVQEWSWVYNSQLGKNVRQKGLMYVADNNGHFQEKVDPAAQKRGYRESARFEITWNGDRLETTENPYRWYSRNVDGNEAAPPQLYLFTDRKLYRPGQILHVKGLLVQTDGEGRNPRLLTGRKTVLKLRDANQQLIDSVPVESNDYGSFSTRFTLPANGLTGGFTLLTQTEQGSAYVQVEEYKRPKFEVSFEPVKAAFRLNDTITVTGLAKAYAGNNIDGAKVSYKVVRRARWLYPWMGRSWWPSTQEKEIAHGSSITNASGQFTIPFVAVPDRSIDPAQNPLFDYVMYADVTDLNGETRSGETTVTAAYTALQLQVDLKPQLSADSVGSIKIKTENLASEFQQVPVTVTVQRLEEENRLIRKRYWQQPDQFVFSKEDYIRLFPHDEYKNESDYKNWEKGAIIVHQVDSSRADGSWTWPTKNWKPGFYVVACSIQDPSGREVKAEYFVEIIQPGSPSLNRPVYLQAISGRPIEPGEQSQVQLASSASSIFLIQSAYRPSRDSLSRLSYLDWKSGRQQFNFDASEADRGGYWYSWGFVKDNRFFEHTEFIEVPWTNKDLNIEYLSYRDKTLPGSQETWKIRISGRQKEKMAAEVLASMYDASLDQFYPFAWNKPGLYYATPEPQSWSYTSNFHQESSDQYSREISDPFVSPSVMYDQLIGVNGMSYQYTSTRLMRLEGAKMEMPAAAMQGFANLSIQRNEYSSDENEVVRMDKSGNMSFAFTPDGDGVNNMKEEEQAAANSSTPQIRNNFNETAFFLPELYTDEEGNIEFSFTLPDALTRWKFQSLAHTQDLKLGYGSLEIVTQKELMLQPNPPRFLREGDKIEFSAKLVNLTQAELTGQVRLELLNAATKEPLDSRFRVVVPRQYFTAAAGQSAGVAFEVEVPFQFAEAITWRMIAESGRYSDGEEASLPVLSNRILLTESMPLQISTAGTKTFSFEKLKNAASSETIQHQRLTVEYSSNPAWYAVQALPYLMEFPYECAEQNWNRYYANALAQHITGSSPRIREVFETWKNADSSALLSNLDKNQELKNILLEETPWVLEATSETEQKKRIAQLFDLMRMKNALSGTLEKLKQLQKSNGAFSWFAGGPDDRYMTQYILSGIGHLQKIGALPAADRTQLNAIIKAGLLYLDQKLANDYQELLRRKTDLKKYAPSAFEIQYLYMRSFFADQALPANTQKAANYFRSRLPLIWTKQNKYLQGMIALVLHRAGDKKNPAAILRSLKETSIVSAELGRYYKSNTRGWYWQDAPIERQALLIEAFTDISRDTKTVDELRTWLLKNKQTNRWESTRATAEACYALLMQGSNWLAATPAVTIQLGDKSISSTTSITEAGTGYFKEIITGEDVQASMGNIRLQVEPGAGQKTVASSWGAVYWQYFEDMDKVTSAATPLELKKKIYVQRNTDRGPILEEIQEGQYIGVGDKVVVRVELKVDRDMEYVHLKDLRAAGLEPVDVISGYRWQNATGYYQSTRDVASHFFFDYLRKGNYVFEYTLFANHAGDFSSGVASIECMYAPEFRAHSNGGRLRVSPQQ